MALDPAFLKLPIAHRGLHDLAAGRVENSLRAFSAAIEAGYGIELDVQMSSDAKAMVFHDDTLDRVTNRTGLVRDLTARELEQIALTGGHGDCIPTLEDVLRLVNGRVPLLIEIKDQSGSLNTKGIGPLERAASKALEGYAGPVAVMSFNPESVAAFVSYSPHVARGLTTDPFYKEIWQGRPVARLASLAKIPDLVRLGADFISHNVLDLNSPRVKEIRASGLPVLSWTIQTQDVADIARAMSDNITFEGFEPPLP